MYNNIVKDKISNTVRTAKIFREYYAGNSFGFIPISVSHPITLKESKNIQEINDKLMGFDFVPVNAIWVSEDNNNFFTASGLWIFDIDEKTLFDICYELDDIANVVVGDNKVFDVFEADKLWFAGSDFDVIVNKPITFILSDEV